MNNSLRAFLGVAVIGFMTAGCDEATGPRVDGSAVQLSTSKGEDARREQSPRVRNREVTRLEYADRGEARITQGSRRARIEARGLEGSLFYQDAVATEAYLGFTQDMRLDLAFERNRDGSIGVKVSGESVMSLVLGVDDFRTEQAFLRITGEGACQPTRGGSCSEVLIHTMELAGRLSDESGRGNRGMVTLEYNNVYLDIWEQPVTRAWLHGYGTVSGVLSLRVMPGDNVRID